MKNRSKTQNGVWILFAAYSLQQTTPPGHLLPPEHCLFALAQKNVAAAVAAARAGTVISAGTVVGAAWSGKPAETDRASLAMDGNVPKGFQKRNQKPILLPFSRGVAGRR